jgi:hypothetical protein
MEQNSKPHQYNAPATRETAPAPQLNPSAFCPDGSAKLLDNRKLTCPKCGFYLSCSDFHRFLSSLTPYPRSIYNCSVPQIIF